MHHINFSVFLNFPTLAQLELGVLGLDGAEEKLWFPIGAYVACICLYCSMGSMMFVRLLYSDTTTNTFQVHELGEEMVLYPLISLRL